eukprot:1160786-Pelagomonas_calceolata.AAC.17
MPVKKQRQVSTESLQGAFYAHTHHPTCVTLSWISFMSAARAAAVSLASLINCKEARNWIERIYCVLHGAAG